MEEKEARTAILERIETKLEKKAEVKTHIMPDFELDKQDSLNLKELKKEQTYTSTVIETPNYDFIESLPKKEEAPATQTEPKKDPKFRLRLIVAVYCIIIAICSAWVISNAVNINQANAGINEANTAYEINEAKYILKIEQLDNAQPEEDGKLSPIAPENIFGVEPEPLADIAEPLKNTNWFDMFCNWVSKIFGA